MYSSKNCFISKYLGRTGFHSGWNMQIWWQTPQGSNEGNLYQHSILGNGVHKCWLLLGTLYTGDIDANLLEQCSASSIVKCIHDGSWKTAPTYESYFRMEYCQPLPTSLTGCLLSRPASLPTTWYPREKYQEVWLESLWLQLVISVQPWLS